jgi:hypothetical protein
MCLLIFAKLDTTQRNALLISVTHYIACWLWMKICWLQEMIMEQSNVSSNCCFACKEDKYYTANKSEYIYPKIVVK